MRAEFDERPSNTAEQVENYIGAAIQLVDALQIPDDLRVAVFVQAVQLYSAKTLIPRMSQALPGVLLGRDG